MAFYLITKFDREEQILLKKMIISLAHHFKLFLLFIHALFEFPSKYSEFKVHYK